MSNATQQTYQLQKFKLVVFFPPQNRHSVPILSGQDDGTKDDTKKVVYSPTVKPPFIPASRERRGQRRGFFNLASIIFSLSPSRGIEGV
ncbi:MAG: hypothetical protein AUJ23_00430 [Candidatus Magasanikbacteria bacterium CG1_02_32_51]|uniref:Uncharacterized protein n=1 Tax=Candidatus Magasanikbacteria bacterium CG1_02_32_51 TaxID=1805238 RepID=A0A1J4UD60_9BACT|nr:MAG: hypothetical protein AUJ23_00430 [Candidatus Magasanikbacteria bacterium CG1_02_32_51]